ncbi:MAG TPA: protein kinase [Blastocatellia bacterium]|jgi:hypothetical protein|nr:protein kinase [Blastocatellia bacterium]
MSGRVIGNYRIADYIGSGGFGSVFKAEDVNTPGRIVAIKELHKKHTRNAVIKQRFFQEAVAMARLDHPNLPRLFTFGEDNGSYYLVMEFISGTLLTDEIRESGGLKAPAATAIISQVLDGVSYAHENGIIHRDLKPDNLMLTNGDALRVKVLDFGIARMVGGENLTMTGEGFGTPAYMSPERITGEGRVDHRTDIYSLGIILVQMLTGKPPFESRATDPAAYWFEMRKLHESQDLPPLSPLGVPVGLEAIIRRAAAKRIEDRYQTAREMLGEIRRFTGESAQLEIGTARLIVTTAPGAANVFVDEIPRGISEELRGKLLIEGLTSGVHTVRVSKVGFSDYRISVSIESGQQTDLQVALAANTTMPIPRFDNDTSVVGVSTQAIDNSDTVRTAMLVVESVPAGSTVFVGTRPVALADAAGRATFSLQPGVHEVQVSAPSGGTRTQFVTVTDQDTGSLKTITLPIPPTTPTDASVRVIKREPTRTGQQVAMAVVLILLAALGAASYFVIRGPARIHDPVESAGLPPPQPAETASTTPPEPVTKVTVPGTEDKKPKDSADLAAQKKSKDASASDEKVLAEKQSQHAAPATAPGHPADIPAPAQPNPPAQSQAEPSVAEGACIVVALTGPNGQPGRGVRLTLALESGNSYSGQTNANGRWHRCGLTIGQRGKVIVFGPAGGGLASRPVIVTAGRSFVTIQIEGPSTHVTTEPNDNRIFRPRRRPPFSRRPL